ncbi:glycosyltransferase [Acinetobacter sp. ANC 4277]|uniref:glycosyltransferase n=1 Tax=Acinetobacter terrae TaxID=2731247 RepID=UPI00149079A0|nr:glycosyltransferase [Acinetobacter terrae]NNG75321.1 glycosyltransferase [Acinetobacter terrae]
MILFDSVYINDGGGFVLLNYLVQTLKNSDLDVFYLFDNRTKAYFEDDVALINKDFINNSVYDRKRFYLKNKEKFDFVLCFGNVPPPIRLKAKVFVYFHQPLFLKIPENFSIKNKITYKIKQVFLNYYKGNTDLWLVQSLFIKSSFAKKYLKNDMKNIMILPFYPPLNFDNISINREKNTFLYASNSAPHKNHENLIHAFCDAYDQTKAGALIVTIPQSDEKLCTLIEDKINVGYPLKNVGFIDRESLIELYLSAEYLIFPSLAESFGLGLAEAVDAGCKVIASDLSYTYQVCNPSLTFNPFNRDNIRDAIIKAMREDLPSSQKIISNDINQLILLLSE